MRIRNRILCWILPMILIVVFVTSFSVLYVVQEQIKEDKLHLNEDLQKQMLTSFTYISDDIEYYVFNSYTSEQIASLFYREQYDAIREFQVISKLDNMVNNSQYVDEAYIISENDEQYINTDASDRLQAYSDMVEQGMFSTNNDIFWNRDCEGNLYLRRNIYNLFPYERVAAVIVKVNKESLNLGSLSGLYGMDDGTVILLDRTNKEILSKDGSSASLQIRADMSSCVAKGDTPPEVLEKDGVLYYIITTQTEKKDWTMIRVVSENELLKSYRVLKKIIYVFAGIWIVMTVILSIGASRSITKNLMVLMRYIKRISNGEMSLRIPFLGKDEVGELAENFNWMLEQIEQTYDGIMKEAAEKQHVRYELLEFKYRSLQAQISPHFVSNILSAISSLAYIGKTEEVENLSIQAAKYFRENLKMNNHKYTTVQQEMNAVELYTQIFHSVYEKPIEISLHIDYEIALVKIPNTLLQPLVENSIKYGMKTERNFCLKIDVSADQYGDFVRLQVRDNGCGYELEVLEEVKKMLEEPDDSKEQSNRIGFGLAGNIHRLRILYGSSFHMFIQSEEGKGSVTTIDIPITDKNVCTKKLL